MIFSSFLIIFFTYLSDLSFQVPQFVNLKFKTYLCSQAFDSSGNPLNHKKSNCRKSLFRLYQMYFEK
jgi:hypothetical protein